MPRIPAYIRATGSKEDVRLSDYHPEAQISGVIDPDKFLKLLGRGGTLGEGFMVTKESYNRILSLMMQGEPIDAVFIDFDPYQGKVLRHEGRHRALVARNLEIDKIPIVVYLYDDRNLHDKVDEYGVAYDTTHYIPTKFFSKEELDAIMARLGISRE